MTIQNLVDVCKDITLHKLQFKSFYIGNTWDMSAGKADIYPCLWLEMPVLVDYQTINKINKQFTFSLDLIILPKLDDTTDEINMISHMEEYADEFLYYLKQNPDFILMDFPTGLTIKSINADNACGIRLDIKVKTGRVCPPLDLIT